ncbi:hypothetical protein ABNF65_17105, partial [Paenibacillus larvae]
GYEYGSFHFLEPSFLHNYTDSTAVHFHIFIDRKKHKKEQPFPEGTLLCHLLLFLVSTCLFHRLFFIQLANWLSAQDRQPFLLPFHSLQQPAIL